MKLSKEEKDELKKQKKQQKAERKAVKKQLNAEKKAIKKQRNAEQKAKKLEEKKKKQEINLQKKEVKKALKSSSSPAVNFEEDEIEDLPKKSKKKLLIIITIPIVLLAIAGTFFFIAFKRNAIPKMVDAYTLDQDTVESISTFLGEDRILSDIVEDISEDEESKEEVLTGITYLYDELETVSEDMKSYVNYLIDDCGYLPFEEIDMKQFDKDTLEGSMSLATNSADEGMIFKIDIDYTNESYNIKISKSDEPLPEPEPEEEKKPFTRSNAKSVLNKYSSEDLGLENDLSTYETIFDVGRSLVEDYTCYGVNVYVKGNDGKTNKYIGKYFVSTDGNTVFRYNVEDSSYTKVESIESDADERQKSELEEQESDELENSDEKDSDEDEKDEGNSSKKDSNEDEKDKGNSSKKDSNEDEKDKGNSNKKDSDEDEKDSDKKSSRR